MKTTIPMMWGIPCMRMHNDSDVLVEWLREEEAVVCFFIVHPRQRLRWELRHGGQVVRTGTLDRRGIVRVYNLEKGPYQLSLETI
jgi:hypothetical protein